MKQRPRIYYSASQRAVIWERWRKGETIHQIAGLFDRGHSSMSRRVRSRNGDGGLGAVRRKVSMRVLTGIARSRAHLCSAPKNHFGLA
jgi:hypothetical protein